MKKITKILIELLIVLGLISICTQFAAFAGYLPIPDEATENIYRGEGHLPIPTTILDTDQPLDGLGMAKTLLLNAMGYVKVITAVIAILYITIMGYRLVQNSDDEETLNKTKNGMVYAIIALVAVSMSEDVAKIFDMEKKSILSSPQEILNRIHLFDKQVEIVITFIKYIIGSYAVLMIARSAIKLITSGGNDEETGKHKTSILYSAGGLILIYIGDVFINKVFYKVDKTTYSGMTGVHPGVDPQEGVSQLIGITNFIVSFVGPVAVLMLIVGAIMYATSGGEEEAMNKAKRVLISTGIGIVVIFAAFALVSTVISGRLGDAGAIIE